MGHIYTRKLLVVYPKFKVHWAFCNFFFLIKMATLLSRDLFCGCWGKVGSPSYILSLYGTSSPPSLIRSISKITEIQSHNLAKGLKSLHYASPPPPHPCQKKHKLWPSNFTEWNVSSGNSQTSGFQKKKKRLLKAVHCHTVYTGRAEPPSCPTTED